jgi:hypothetical protein
MINNGDFFDTGYNISNIERGKSMVEYLYHYTNLGTLKLILHKRTFHLSSLNRMDDLVIQKIFKS